MGIWCTPGCWIEGGWTIGVRDLRPSWVWNLAEFEYNYLSTCSKLATLLTETNCNSDTFCMGGSKERDERTWEGQGHHNLPTGIKVCGMFMSNFTTSDQLLTWAAPALSFPISRWMLELFWIPPASIYFSRDRQGWCMANPPIPPCNWCETGVSFSPSATHFPTNVPTTSIDVCSTFVRLGHAAEESSQTRQVQNLNTWIY